MRSLGKSACLVVIGVYLASAVLAPVLAPFGESAIVGQVWQPPDATHWLGTDMLGRDMLSRLLYGGRRTIFLAFAITLIGAIFGVTFGLTAAIVGRWYDTILSRVNDIVMSLPSLIVALLVLSILGSSIPVLVLVIAFLEATRFFRLSRAVGMELRERDYVEAARLRGEGLLWIFRREILPNAIGLLIVEVTLRFGFSVLFISALSFLGLGVQPPYADWGDMVRENAVALNFGLIAPLVPAAAIAGLAVTANILVDILSVGSGVAL
jgi:peptide/nickel transport system permease protein